MSGPQAPFVVQIGEGETAQRDRFDTFADANAHLNGECARRFECPEGVSPNTFKAWLWEGDHLWLHVECNVTNHGRGRPI